MTTTIKQATDYILHRVCEPSRGISPLKLQKLLYYVQGWHLALFGKPLFKGEFQAWVHGPVNREVYDRFVNAYSLYTPIRLEQLSDVEQNLDKIPAADRSFIDEVLQSYAGFSGDQLEYMTHRESPWINARAGLPDYVRSEAIISEADMQECYSRMSQQS